MGEGVVTKSVKVVKAKSRKLLYVRVCVRARRAFLELFTQLWWNKLAVVVTLAWSVGKERFVGLKFISDVWQKTLEIFRKMLEIFRKTWEFFSGSSERRSRRSKVLQAQWRMRQSQCRAKG